MMHGKGLYIFTNGKRYNGDWFEGDMHGKGIMKYTDGYYEGDWVHDKRERKGKFLWSRDEKKGDIYEGEWKDDEKNGKGIYKKANGDVYEVNGKMMTQLEDGNLQEKVNQIKILRKKKIMFLKLSKKIIIAIIIIQINNLKKNQKEVISEINME